MRKLTTTHRSVPSKSFVAFESAAERAAVSSWMMTNLFAEASHVCFVPLACPRRRFASAQAYLDRATQRWTILSRPRRCSCYGLDGLQLQQALADRKEQIVFITGHGDVPMCTQAMKAGAVDFLTKPVDEQTLLAAVHRALERSVENRKAKVERSSARAKLDRLTPREFEVLQGSSKAC